VLCRPGKYRKNEFENKIRKRIFPIQIIHGSVEIGQPIKDNEKTIGKIISLDPACFGILDAEEGKHLLDQTISLEQSSIKILKPYWLNLIKTILLRLLLI